MNVLTVLKSGGEYGSHHVQWLAKQIGINLHCISDVPLDIPNVIRIPSQHDWRGWWCKMEMFRPDIDWPFLYCDLDTVFLKGVPDWNIKETTVLSDMYGQAHINSGLMYIANEDKKQIWDAWMANPQKHMNCLPGGDQMFLDVFWRKKQRFQGVYNGEVVSYKADVIPKGFTGREKIVCFHGQPRPWDAAKSELWIPQL